MPGPIQLMLQTTIKDGKEGAFQDLARTGPREVRTAEPDTLDYRWVRQEGTPNVWFLDLYASSDAFVRHFQNMQSSGALDAVMDCVDIHDVYCVGDVEAPARSILDGLGTTYLTPVAGFSRVEALAAATATH